MQLHLLLLKDFFTTREHTEYNQGFAIIKGFLFSTNPLRCFTFHIPWKHIFVFGFEYKKVIYGMKQTLTLTRAVDTEALYRNGTVDGKVLISDISWYMKQVKPSPEYHTSIISIIV